MVGTAAGMITFWKKLAAESKDAEELCEEREHREFFKDNRELGNGFFFNNFFDNFNNFFFDYSFFNDCFNCFFCSRNESKNLSNKFFVDFYTVCCSECIKCSCFCGNFFDYFFSSFFDYFFSSFFNYFFSSFFNYFFSSFFDYFFSSFFNYFFSSFFNYFFSSFFNYFFSSFFNYFFSSFFDYFFSSFFDYFFSSFFDYFFSSFFNYFFSNRSKKSNEGINKFGGNFNTAENSDRVDGFSIKNNFFCFNDLTFFFGNEHDTGIICCDFFNNSFFRKGSHSHSRAHQSGKNKGKSFLHFEKYPPIR